MQVLRGLPGLVDTMVADAVVASCALPGIFLPVINGCLHVDGVGGENLPGPPCRLTNGPILAVTSPPPCIVRPPTSAPGSPPPTPAAGDRDADPDRGRFAIGRGPVIPAQPRVEHIWDVRFDRNECCSRGYRAASQTLASLGGQLNGVTHGMHPTRRLRVLVDDSRCVGCGACVVQAPKVFRLDARGKAEVHTPVQTWSPVDGAYLLNCPTYAISVQPEDSAA